MTSPIDRRNALIPQQVLITAIQLRKLEEHTKRTGLKKSEVFRRALQRWLDDPKSADADAD
jgi:hypothetical protein